MAEPLIMDVDQWQARVTASMTADLRPCVHCGRIEHVVAVEEPPEIIDGVALGKESCGCGTKWAVHYKLPTLDEVRELMELDEDERASDQPGLGWEGGLKCVCGGTDIAVTQIGGSDFGEVLFAHCRACAPEADSYDWQVPLHAQSFDVLDYPCAGATLDNGACPRWSAATMGRVSLAPSTL